MPTSRLIFNSSKIGFRYYDISCYKIILRIFSIKILTKMDGFIFN